MALFVPARVNITSEIVRLLELASRKAGELSAHQHSFQDQMLIENIATIDAVHFSTKIEGNKLSRDQVTEALKSKKIRAPQRELREVLNYARARRMIRDWSLQSRAMNEDWVLRHHGELLKGIVTGRLRGHYRHAQCVIRDSVSNRIVYMAPEWGDVPGLVKGLLKWLRQEQRAGVSPLLLAAQFHFEFVTIHPFMDGNGRLARLLTNGILLSNQYDVERYAALEKQHEQNRAAYYRAIRTLQSDNYYDIPQHQDISSWVVYWLGCLDRTYDEALGRLKFSGTTEFSIQGGSEDRIRKAQSLFRRHQKLRASEYADLLGVGRTQAVADLNMLVKEGIIERIGGGRSTVYQIQSTKKNNK